MFKSHLICGAESSLMKIQILICVCLLLNTNIFSESSSFILTNVSKNGLEHPFSSLCKLYAVYSVYGIQVFYQVLYLALTDNLKHSTNVTFPDLWEAISPDDLNASCSKFSMNKLNKGNTVEPFITPNFCFQVVPLNRKYVIVNKNFKSP